MALLHPHASISPPAPPGTSRQARLDVQEGDGGGRHALKHGLQRRRAQVLLLLHGRLPSHDASLRLGRQEVRHLRKGKAAHAQARSR